MIKDTMKRKKPSFNETYHGYRTFSELLEDAQTQGLLELEVDKRSRTYVVTRFGSETKTEASPAGKKKRRRRGKKKSAESSADALPLNDVAAEPTEEDTPEAAPPSEPESSPLPFDEEPPEMDPVVPPT